MTRSGQTQGRNLQTRISERRVEHHLYRYCLETIANPLKQRQAFHDMMLGVVPSSRRLEVFRSGDHFKDYGTEGCEHYFNRSTYKSSTRARLAYSRSSILASS